MHKISIITPAYQAEKFIQRYIDSVLNFDYANLELILVNDGSTDKTHDIIESNRKKIEEAGIELKYINLKENKGQANALDMGLKCVTGDYLSWQDVDDIFYPNCLSRSLEVLLENPDCKLVFSKALEVDENRNYNKEQPLYIPRKEFVHKNLFKDYIRCRNVIFAPMRFVETKALFDVLKNKSIYVSSGGQNWQLFLPMTYKYKWVYIDEVLSEYVVYSDSHSHCVHPKKYRKSHFDILVNTINSIDMPFGKKAYYLLYVLNRYIKLFIKDRKSMV